MCEKFLVCKRKRHTDVSSVQPDDHAQLTYEITPRFKPFTDKYYHAINKTTNK